MMEARDVLDALDVLDAVGIEPILDGGWGIDALLGEQNRDHDDLDLVVPLVEIDTVVAALTAVGFALRVDLRPTRLVLADRDGHQIDLHPVRIDADGDWWQTAAAPDGSDAHYPASDLASGWVAGRPVRCISANLQVRHHTGYDPQSRDLHDLDLLQGRFGVSLPERYR